jgi:hypothetical protein
MDPYLERHWGDVHSSLIIYARDQLRPKLPNELRARVEERVFVESDAEPTHSIYTDVRVVEHERRDAGGGAVAVAVETEVAAEPVVVEVRDEPVTQTYIDIIDATSGGRIVTTIEFLGPFNKVPGKGRDLYLERQEELKSGRVNSVEIDLLRSGRRTFAIPDASLPPTHREAHAAYVRRAHRPARYELYAFPLRQRLPSIRIPLRPTDADVLLNLQPLIDQCYENGGYDTIDYSADPDPPLAPDDARWTDALLREKGTR